MRTLGPCTTGSRDGDATVRAKALKFLGKDLHHIWVRQPLFDELVLVVKQR